ncbi:MAG: O-antigen ligase family protein [Sedimenticola sp.]|nr:O-antigen ligase family protein [Sedimenticola sp.]
MQSERLLSTTRPDKQFWLSLLVVLPLLLLPIGRSAELPIAIMALWGIWRAATGFASLAALPQARHFTLLFLLIWLPIVLSYPDSANAGQTLRVAVSYLRFYFAGLFIITALVHTPIPALTSRTISWFVLFLLFDALVQSSFGSDIFGFPYAYGRVNGLFGEDLKLGIVLSLLSPYALFLSSRRSLATGVVVWCLLLLIVLLTGSRASWIMLAVSTAGYLYFQLKDKGKKALPYVLLIATLFPAGSLGIYLGSDYAKQRIDTTMLIFEGDRTSVDYALSTRLPIWEAAIKMLERHPLNGIGARSFRDAYFDYVDSDDKYHEIGITPTHTHQILLEVGAETGLIGLAFLLAFYFVIFRNLFRNRANNLSSAPFAISLLVAIFPINTHLAIYSSFWGMILWLLIAFYCATMGPEQKRPKT